MSTQGGFWNTGRMPFPPRPTRVSETWFPIASAPENEWVQVRWERAAGVVARMRLSWGQMSWETRSGFVIKPTSWRLLPEQDALKGEHHEL